MIRVLPVFFLYITFNLPSSFRFLSIFYVLTETTTLCFVLWSHKRPDNSLRGETWSGDPQIGSRIFLHLTATCRLFHNFHSHSVTNLPKQLISPPLGRICSERWTNSLTKLKCLCVCLYLFHFQLLKRKTDFHQTWLKVMPVKASKTLKPHISCTS